MSATNSSKALKLFNKLEKTGDLVNVYSDIFFKRIKNLDKNFELPFSGKDIEVEWDTTKNTVIWGQWCDCSLAKEELGWEAQTSLRDGLTIVYNDIKQRV